MPERGLCAEIKVGGVVMLESRDSIVNIYNCDDEEPICTRCDNQDCEELCSKMCGPEHGWYGYQRTEEEENA